MIILHYFLGFPTWRSGGLTRFAVDLMKEQYKHGHDVAALWPGQMSLLSSRLRIAKRKDTFGIKSFELINPLPVPLDEGIVDPNAFMKSCDPTVYKNFLQSLKPDVIHIHTLMGLHTEFLDITQEMGIKTVFTTHDYFGICPTVHLFYQGKVCPMDSECKDCTSCNAAGLSIRNIYLLQSLPYRFLKNTVIFRKLRKKHRSAYFSSIAAVPVVPQEDKSEQYRQLRSYYTDMLGKIDLIHYNSSVSERIYRQFINPKDSCRIVISHAGIKDHRDTVQLKPSKTLRLTNLSPASDFKGYSVLIEALDHLWNRGRRDFHLTMYAHVPEARPYMTVNENGFSAADMPDIFSETDILVAPSVWYETLGFTVLEALSFGVPVLISDNVGAQDVVGNGGIIVKSGNVKELIDAIESLNSEKLACLRAEIKREYAVPDMDYFVKEMQKRYE